MMKTDNKKLQAYTARILVGRERKKALSGWDQREERARDFGFLLNVVSQMKNKLW